MSNILLIEPDYKNKYPPIGLMKIANFHKNILHDYVRFTKGRLPSALENGKWDRVYVTTLFTFEWAETIDAIKYAISLVDSPKKVIVGGIAATLMPEQIFRETGIHPVCGLLNQAEKLGLPGDECIDQLIPDYSILDEISDKYVYPFQNAYFLAATRGCGMKCGFCAVQTLEPQYIPYMDIKEKIRAIDLVYGQKKDLLLMDNNVLRSTHFNQIIDDIIAAGFGKGASFMNPKTGKTVGRYVDFNQGLDANFLTPEKARRLGEIALRPARIAFDHIEDKDTYEFAIRLCAENGITELSNYILYNSEEFGGKGNIYQADTPANLYDRMRFTFDLKEDINQFLPEDRKVNIFSFPMRYIPLSAVERGYVGSKWNKKFLRAVQCMLIPTQGKGVGSRSFFEADFGTNANEFVKYLSMPDRLIAARGDFSLSGRGRANETDEQADDRKRHWDNNQLRLAEWNRLYELLGDERDEFVEKISDNEYLPEKLLNMRTDIQKKIYIHYLTEPRTFALLGKLEKGSPTREMIKGYISYEFSTLYEDLLTLLVSSKTQQQYMFINFIGFFGQASLHSILGKLEPSDYDADTQLATWSKATKKEGQQLFDFDLIRLYRRYVALDVLPSDAHSLAREAIRFGNTKILDSILNQHIKDFYNKINTCFEGELGEQSIRCKTERFYGRIQLKLSEIAEDIE